jgi:DNA-binding response OmpR family regulator
MRTEAMTAKEKTMGKDNIKILLVDDEEDFVKTLSERIQMRALGTDVALNGEEALKLVDNEVPDVMVLDLKMPGIDGMEVLRRVKKAYPQVQVIILTGHGSEKDEEQARRLGAFDYLQKPVEIDNLVNKIRRAYKNKIEKALVAATFAEAGEFDTATKILDKDQDK